MSDDIQTNVDRFMDLMTGQRGIFRQKLDEQIRASAKYQSEGGDMDDIIRQAAEKVFEDAAKNSAHFSEYGLQEVVTLVSAELAVRGYGEGHGTRLRLRPSSPDSGFDRSAG